MSFMSVYRWISKPWSLLFILLLLTGLFFWVDKPLAIYFHGEHFYEFAWLKAFTKLGLGGIYFLGLLVLGMLFRLLGQKDEAAQCFYLWLCAVIASVLCVVLKIFLGRARPDLWFNEHLYGFYGLHSNSYFWSFPSGHTTTVIAVCFGLWTLFPKYFWIWLTFAFSIAFSRVMLTQHYLSDVLSAIFLTAIEIGLLNIFLSRKQWLNFKCENHPK